LDSRALITLFTKKIQKSFFHFLMKQVVQSTRVISRVNATTWTVENAMILTPDREKLLNKMGSAEGATAPKTLRQKEQCRRLPTSCPWPPHA